MPGSFTPQSLRPRLPAWPPASDNSWPGAQPTVACRLMCFLSHVFCNKFCEFLQLVCFSCHLQVTLVPGPRAVKPARFFATRHANKMQGLSSQYRHFKLFSISTGRNKPPGEISQSPRPRPPRRRGRAGSPCVLASPRGCPARSSWTYSLAGCLVRALAPPWLQQPCASRQSLLPF